MNLIMILSVADQVLHALEHGFPYVHFLVIGQEISLAGTQANIDVVVSLLEELIGVTRYGIALDATAIEQVAGLFGCLTPSEAPMEEILSAHGRSIRSKTPGQKAYTDAIDRTTVVFGTGPAGTGKTCLVMAQTICRLLSDEVRRIVLARPAVEAGESLDFLSGSLTDKTDPYLRPLYGTLGDIPDPEALPRLMVAGTIEVAPLAYMHGRTLNNSFIILDEAQNTTVGQMKVFLTHLGFGSKVVIMDDASQIDLPGNQTSGLSIIKNVLDDIDDIEFCHLTSADVVCHELVGAVIDAYQRLDDRNAACRARTRSHDTVHREYTS